MTTKIDNMKQRRSLQSNHLSTTPTTRSSNTHIRCHRRRHHRIPPFGRTRRMATANAAVAAVAVFAVCVVCLAVCIGSLPTAVNAFATTQFTYTTRTQGASTTTFSSSTKAATTTTTTALFAAPNTASKHSADFDYQELTIQLKAMYDQKIFASQRLGADKRLELEGYVRRIVEQRPSTLPLQRLGDALPTTSWRLAFSTEGGEAALPNDATVSLQFADDTANDDNTTSSSSQPRKNKTVDYALNFQKTLGLNKLTAKSTYDVTADGVVSIEYQSITTDVLGFTNVGVGPFGMMLQGRGVYIPTAYFDGRMWIERGGGGNDDNNNKEYFNVYVRNEK